MASSAATNMLLLGTSYDSWWADRGENLLQGQSQHPSKCMCISALLYLFVRFQELWTRHGVGVYRHRRRDLRMTQESGDVGRVEAGRFDEHGRHAVTEAVDCHRGEAGPLDQGPEGLLPPDTADVARTAGDA